MSGPRRGCVRRSGSRSSPTSPHIHCPTDCCPMSRGRSTAPTRPGAIACLMLAGFSQSLAMISIAVILMRTASAHFRGRVMGVRMLAIYGLPLGLLAAGGLIDEIGFAATGTLYAAAGLALMLAIVLHWRADLWHVHAPANAK